MSRISLGVFSGLFLSLSLGIHVCASLLSCVRLFATPGTVALQAPLSMGILQARILEWIAMPSSWGTSQPRDRTQVSEPPGKPKNTGVGSLSLSQGSFLNRNHTRVSCIAGRFFTSCTMRESLGMHSPFLIFLVYAGLFSPQVFQSLVSVSCKRGMSEK